MSGRPGDDPLAYGDYHGDGEQGDRGLLGDVTKKFFGKPEQGSGSGHSSGGGLSSIFDKVHGAVHQLGSEFKDKISAPGESGHAQSQEVHSTSVPQGSSNRFQSFAPQRQGNDIKWYVDGCSYMWAVSKALENARESVWILDWWLSPELYLRRPPAKNEQYRIDNMLKAAAERGVKVNVIVYKEVTQALTRKFLNPILPNYLHSLLPETTDSVTKLLTRLGLDIIFKSLEVSEEASPLIQPPITVSSAHTKHRLEEAHPNIAVFRHPDHLPDRQTIQSDLVNSLKNLSLNAATLSKLPGDSISALYGMNEGTVLYWAHHEKLCLIDGHTAFMGGLDLCYGRWDTNSHPIADAHPGDLNRIVFPGQDFNNARIMDFEDVPNWEANKLDRTQSSRMGWSDIALCVSGPVVDDLRHHFVERWNFIYDEKYNVRKDARYSRLAANVAAPSQPYRGLDEGEGGERGFEEGEEGDRGLFHGHKGGFRDKLLGQIGQGIQQFGGHHQSQEQQSNYQSEYQGGQQHRPNEPRGGVSCQITRSAAKWSHGITLEHSIANAYAEIIKNSEHFVYIENQFFITATSDSQKPVKNKIGAALVERIVRAARNGEKYKVFVMMPAVPAFAGDLKSDGALGTRAIMEFQYDSISRGGNSIYEQIAKEGFNPTDYIRFYNLRNYDRINASGAMAAAELESGVPYEEARKQHDATYANVYPNDATQSYQPYHPPEGAHGSDGGYQPYRPEGQGYGQAAELDSGYGGRSRGIESDRYQQYQQGAQQIGDRKGLGSGRWDSVSECYMLGGEDIRNVPWESGAMNEIDAFVSEELYIHSKLLIADDRIVICGSANLNDRSQLGNHDSEIAIIVEDPDQIDTYMNGRPWRASKFAASLRRFVFRKHLGLVPYQDMERPNENFEPIGVPNAYDWGSREDQTVADPLSDEFLNIWYNQARTNTEAFGRLFHPVPSDAVKNWKEYDDYYGRFFSSDESDKDNKKPSKYKCGHIVSEEFAPGEQGIREVKEILSTIRGTLVEMPLLFLKEEDIAKEGVSLNAFTEELYT